MEQMLLGEILVNFHLISQADLDRCLQFQQQLERPRPLGEILISQGLIDEQLLATVLGAQRQDLDMGRTKLNMSGHELARHLERATAYDYLAVARKLGVSDLFLTSGRSPAVRRHGKLVDLPIAPLSFRQCRTLLFSVLNRQQMATFYAQKALDTPIALPGIGRFRANIFRHLGGIGGVFRVLSGRLPAFDELGLPPIVREFASFPSGLVLITGTTAAGKSTTLAALIELINQSRKLHVITLEDPIETVFKSDKALVTQREINTHTTSYADALRAALREDPDVIVVGEMRDPQTVATALTAAETGHLVFGTLHTRNAHATVVRIIDQFPAQKREHVRTMLAGALRAVVCQELVPDADGEGRSLAAEVMVVNTAIANLIREGREWQIPMVMQMNKSRGMQLMDDNLQRLVTEKRIAVEEALYRAADRSRFLAPV